MTASQGTHPTPTPGDLARGRLRARPGGERAGACLDPGLHKLGLGEDRDGLLYVPPGFDGARAAPLVVLLHGAGGVAGQMLPLLQGLADRHGLLVLAPDSRRRDTWDVIHGAYGPDVAFLDRALALVFDAAPVRPDRVAVGGFSDGASYALSLGLANGDLFSDVLAFSPGFAAPAETAGRPRLFISHGDADDVLPVEQCGRHLARGLAAAGYAVDYREFRGGHVVPPALAEAAVEGFLSGRTSP